MQQSYHESRHPEMSKKSSKERSRKRSVTERSRPGIEWVDGLPQSRLDDVVKILLGRSVDRKSNREKSGVLDFVMEQPFSQQDLPARIVVEITSDAPKRDTPDLFPASVLDRCPCQVEPLFHGAQPEDGFGLSNYFLLTLPYNRSEVGRLGHDLSYSLLGVDSIKNASYEAAYGHFVPLESVICPGSAPADKKWSHKAVRLQDSLLIHGEPPGTGIVIGHPDTGWADHPELEPGVLDLARQWNTLDQTHNAKDPMDFPLFKGHGTSTASVLAGRPAGEIAGIAPGATIVPIRCIRSVAVVLDVELARAVWYACQSDVHVISMSVGGNAIPWLEGVIAHAIYKKNIIVCAAAGNGTPFVVYPAAYQDCIAVASTTPTDRPAQSSSYGPQVTVSAPGHKVWEADFEDGKPVPKAGCGTSYATPHVAGAAAIWLHAHGREHLLEVYNNKASLQEVFKLLLRRTARNPGTLRAPGETGDIFSDRVYAWNSSQYGAGILNIELLLNMPLPEADEARRVNPDDWVHTTWTEITYGTFHDFDPQQIEGRLINLFGGIKGDITNTLDRFGAELLQLLMNSKTAFDAFVATGVADVMAAGRQIESTSRDVALAAENAATFAEANITNAVDAIVRAASELTAAAAAGTTIEETVQEAVAEAQKLAEEAAATAEQVIQDAKDAAESAATAVENAADAAAETIENMVDEVSDAVSDTLNAAIDLFK